MANTVDFFTGDWIFYPLPEFDLLMQPAGDAPRWVCICGATLSREDFDVDAVYHFLRVGDRLMVTGPSEVSAREARHWCCPDCWDALPDE